ncbi:MAG: hypothetical protein ABIR66_10070 [Saprospiraceae bacterium]
MPIEIKELKVNIQVRDKSIPIEEIEKIVSNLIQKNEDVIKEDLISALSRKERLNKNR